jgi:phospholipid transport system substrate-binding protein
MFARRHFLAAVVGAACTLALLAPAGASAAAGSQEAQQLIKGLTDEAVAMASNGLTAQQKEKRFRELLHTSFDMGEIARFILGRFWRTTTQAQQQEFMRLFEELTVLTWVKRFDDYGGETIDVVGTAQEGEQGLLIETRVNRAKGQPIPVTWRVRDRDGRLKVVDIVVEGVSMAITHRSEYTAAAQSSGGIDGLLKAMRDKIAQLQSGNG